ncbi:MAG: HU family DNA-binding protein [bacterium]
MNKAQFTEKFAGKNNIPIKIADKIIDTVINEIKEVLIQKRRVEIRGFGSFSVKEYKQYSGRNPKTGDKIEVQKKLAPVFKISKIYKNDLIKDK